jgi:hypothetical protein
VERWVCAPGCPVAALDAQAGPKRSGKVAPGGFVGEDAESPALGRKRAMIREGSVYGDAGGVSRYFPTFAWKEDDFLPIFYQIKAAKKEREEGLHNADTEKGGRGGRVNVHPTLAVKPLALMRWLVRLVTPPGGTVLDPFLGSGTTGCAAVLEGFRFIGIEREETYVKIAEARIAYWLGGGTATSAEDDEEGDDSATISVPAAPGPAAPADENPDPDQRQVFLPLLGAPRRTPA